MKVKAALFDVDGTLTNAHVWHGIMEYFKVHNQRRWTHRAYVAYHYPLYILLKARIISVGTFRKPWPAHLGWYVRGFSLEEAEEVWDWVTKVYMSNHWREDTCQILKQHQKDGYLTFLVSGTPIPLLHRLAVELDANHVIGTDLEVHDGYYTGRSIGSACIDENKVSITQAYLERIEVEIDYDASYAYADSISDQKLLEMVYHPVATYPDEDLRQMAINRSWQIYPP